MSDTSTDLTPTDPDAPLPEAQGDGDPAPLNVEDDAAVDAVIEDGAIEVPGGEKLTTTSQAGKVAGAYRGRIRELKAELAAATTSAAKSADLEQQIAALSARINELQPRAQAYSAMEQAALQATTPEDTSDAEEYARLLDLYTNDGKPDIERGKRGLAIQRRLAEQAAQQSVAPLQQQTVSQQSVYNLARAKNTQLPNGVKADPVVLEHVWKQLDPALTATPEGAMHALVMAVGRSAVMAPAAAQAAQPPAGMVRNEQGQFVKAETIADPIFTERAGGKVGNQATLSPEEKNYIKSAGITEKDYMESVNRAPWLRR